MTGSSPLMRTTPRPSSLGSLLDGGGHSLLCPKANWPALHAEIAAYFADLAAICISAETRERCRGRREQRAVRVSTELAPYLTAFPGVAQVGELTRTTQRTGQVQEQTTEYYLTDCPPQLLDAAAFLELIRAHWSIEMVSSQMTNSALSAGVLSS
jgi:hypothetical protein